MTTRDDGVLVLDVESDQTLSGCPDCGVVAVGRGRRVQVLHDAPCFARAVRVRWFERIWRCREPAPIGNARPDRSRQSKTER